MTDDREMPRFSPDWLSQDISEPDRDRVKLWLHENNVDIDSCAGFDYYPKDHMIICRMFLMDENGRQQLTPDSKPIWAKDIAFTDAHCPPIVTSCRSLHSTL